MSKQSININGNSYAVADLSDVAHTMLANIKVADQKIASLKQELALMQVAREAFGRNLLAHLATTAASAETVQ